MTSYVFDQGTVVRVEISRGEGYFACVGFQKKDSTLLMTINPAKGGVETHELDLKTADIQSIPDLNGMPGLLLAIVRNGDCSDENQKLSLMGKAVIALLGSLKGNDVFERIANATDFEPIKARALSLIQTKKPHHNPIAATAPQDYVVKKEIAIGSTDTEETDIEEETDVEVVSVELDEKEAFAVELYAFEDELEGLCEETEPEEEDEPVI